MDHTHIQPDGKSTWGFASGRCKSSFDGESEGCAFAVDGGAPELDGLGEGATNEESEVWDLANDGGAAAEEVVGLGGSGFDGESEVCGLAVDDSADTEVDGFGGGGRGLEELCGGGFGGAGRFTDIDGRCAGLAPPPVLCPTTFPGGGGGGGVADFETGFECEGAWVPNGGFGGGGAAPGPLGLPVVDRGLGGGGILGEGGLCEVCFGGGGVPVVLVPCA